MLQEFPGEQDKIPTEESIKLDLDDLKIKLSWLILERGKAVHNYENFSGEGREEVNFRVLELDKEIKNVREKEKELEAIQNRILSDRNR